MRRRLLGVLCAGLFGCASPSVETTADVGAGLASQASAGAGAGERPDAAPDASYAPYQDKTAFNAAYRRLTESQYRNVIADMFADAVQINARFEPEMREDGLQAIGNRRLSITTSGLEQYYSVARSIAEQVVTNKARDALIGCGADPEAQAAADCATAFIKGRGQQLFRRPLSAPEIEGFVAVWDKARTETGDFDTGVQHALVAMLMSPDFLFRVEAAEPDPAKPGAHRFDAYTIASRLSFVLWDGPPDAALLRAAANGELHDEEGLAAEVERMLASPKLERGVRAFFTDMMQFEAFDTLTKDSLTYPKFSQAVADSAREETLRFLVDHLVARDRDYREVFTSRDTFLNRTLAAVYDVPYASAEPWSRHTFDKDSERSGVLTQVTFLSLFSHPGSSSPTVRGVRLHDIFLCVATPDPPPDVDFSKVQALENGTVRARLIDHMSNTGCSTCHMISDPAGLALEHFDGLGQYRLLENGEVIDVSASIGGQTFSGAQGLGDYLSGHPLVPACLVRKVHAYSVGRTTATDEYALLAKQQEAFAGAGYRMKALYRTILTHPNFLTVRPPEGVPAGPGTTHADTSTRPAASGGGQ
ncbi:DUF1592 domain-containing protein [bacterium]|nr:DUF1592 domain-containing protein [bacterium]